AMAMVAHPIQSNELDKALKADLRASHFSIGAPEKTAEARTITQTAYVWPDLNLAPAAVKGVRHQATRYSTDVTQCPTYRNDCLHRCVMSSTADPSPTHGVTFLTDLPDSGQPVKRAAGGVLARLKPKGPSSCSAGGSDLKFLEKIHFAPPSADYYDSFPMKPGVDYLGSLARFRDLERMQLMLGQLRVRWPKTWCFCGLDTYLFNSSPKKDGITVEYDFDRESEAVRISKLERELDKAAPAFVFKQRSYGANSHLQRTATTALNLNNALVRLQEAGGGQSTQLLQRFIRGAGEQACITRVCYRCKYPRKPVGYSIANGYTPSDLEDPNSDHNDLTQQCCASTETSVPGGLVVFKRSSGSALEEAAEVAERMLRFSESYFMLKLEWIVVDVLTDGEEKLWCLQVKSFRVASVCRPPRRSLARPKEDPTSPNGKLQLALLGQETEEQEGVGGTATELEKRRAKALGASVKPRLTCSLCRCTMGTQFQTMTGRMLLWLWHSLRAREVHVFPPLQSSALASTSHLTNSHRVCQLCWSVFLAEKELWKAHRAIARVVTNMEPPGGDNDDNFDFVGLLEDLPLVGNIRTHKKGASKHPNRQPGDPKLLAIRDAATTAPVGSCGLAGAAVRGFQFGEEGLQSPRPEY
ncbi:hypothetical protein FOZ62_002098, partial [Perkinsus olseni]